MRDSWWLFTTAGAICAVLSWLPAFRGEPHGKVLAVAGVVLCTIGVILA